MRRTTAALLSVLVLASPAAAQAPDDDGDAKALELFRAGRYEASVPYFQRALDLAEARFGPDDPTLAVEVNNLAEAYRLSDQLDKAESLYLRAVELDERAGAHNGVGLATSLNNLALVYREQNRLEEAERLSVRSLKLLEEDLGPSHPDVARSLNNLGTLYRMQGKPDRARPLQERAVAIADATLSRQHPTAEQLRRNLAALGEPLPATDGRPVVEVPATPPAPVPVPVAKRAPSPAPRRVPLPPPVEPAAPPAARVAAVQAETGATGGGFAVQVAAVPQRDQVGTEWERLAARFPLLRELELQAPQSVEVAGKGTFYRVLAGRFGSRADAEAVCERLRTAGAACRLGRR